MIVAMIIGIVAVFFELATVFYSSTESFGPEVVSVSCNKTNDGTGNDGCLEEQKRQQKLHQQKLQKLHRQNRKDLPSFVLHVGVPKTGTTSIQKLFEESGASLGADGYEYIGNQRGILKCGLCPYSDREKITKQYPNMTMSDDLHDLLCRKGEHSGGGDNNNKKTNVIGSNEFMGWMNHPYYKAWTDAVGPETTETSCGDGFGGPHWNVNVIVTYRRHFDIITSLWDQQYKSSPPSVQRTADQRKSGHHYWPMENGDIRAMTLPKYLEMSPVPRVKQSVMAYTEWSKSFPTTLFHFHQEGDLATNFVCHALPDSNLCRDRTRKTTTAAANNNHSNNNSTTTRRMKATGTTATVGKKTATKTNTKNVNKKNKGRDEPAEEEEQEEEEKSNKSARWVDSDLLVVGAHDRGLVHPSDTRYDLNWKVRGHWNQLVRQRGGKETDHPDLPMDCPDEALQQILYDKSLEEERWAMELIAAATAANNNNNNNHKDNNNNIVPPKVRDFDEHWKATLESGKLCSIDAAKALERGTWKKFFKERYRSFEESGAE